MPHGYPAIFKYSAIADGILAFALAAPPAIIILTLACLGIYHLVNISAAARGAGRAIAPPFALHKLHSGFFVRACHWHFAGDFIAFSRTVLDFLDLHSLILYLT